MKKGKLLRKDIILHWHLFPCCDPRKGANIHDLGLWGELCSIIQPERPLEGEQWSFYWEEWKKLPRTERGLFPLLSEEMELGGRAWPTRHWEPWAGKLEWTAHLCSLWKTDILGISEPCRVAVSWKGEARVNTDSQSINHAGRHFTDCSELTTDSFPLFLTILF
jgi:hypothetical protein